MTDMATLLVTESDGETSPDSRLGSSDSVSDSVVAVATEGSKMHWERMNSTENLLSKRSMKVSRPSHHCQELWVWSWPERAVWMMKRVLVAGREEVWPLAEPRANAPSCPRQRLTMTSIEHSLTRLRER